MNVAQTITVRPLICPICGATVRVPTDGQLPESHRLPEHESKNGANLCAGLVVTVGIAFDKCSKCGCNISKHPSGLCMGCFAQQNTPKGREREAAQAASP